MNTRHRIQALALLLSSLFALGGCGAAQKASQPAGGKLGATDDEQIVNAWVAYRDALKAREGEKAVAVVTSVSIDDYTHARSRALHANREELSTLSAMDRLLAVSLRARLSQQELEKMNGRELLALAVDRGWVGESLDVDVEVDRIEGDVAFVHLRRGDQILPDSLPLVRRDEGQWRVDLHQLIRIGEKALERELEEIAKESETDIDGAILIVLSLIVERQVDESIWEPLAKP